MSRPNVLTTAMAGILCLAACQRKPAPAHPDPDGAVRAFERALADISRADGGADVAWQVLAEVNARLFAESGCRDAWKRWSGLSPDERAAVVFGACKQAYCPKLPEPRPRACSLDAVESPGQVGLLWPELAWASLARDLGRDRAARVFGGLMGLQTVITQPIQVELPQAAASPPEQARPQVRLFCDQESTRVEFGEQHWKLPAQPAGEDLQPLIEALGDGRASAEVVFYADAKVSYHRLVAVVDAVKAAGLNKLAIALPKEQAP